MKKLFNTKFYKKMISKNFKLKIKKIIKIILLILFCALKIINLILPIFGIVLPIPIGDILSIIEDILFIINIIKSFKK